MVIVSYFSEAVLAVKIYNYLRGFQLIADRYGTQNLTKEDVERIHAAVKKDWGPGLTYEYPRINDLEDVKKLFNMCDKWYEEMDSTTDNVKLMRMQFGFIGADKLIVEECKARGTFAGPDNVPQQRRETQLYDLVQTEFKSKDRNGRIRKIFVVDFISSMVYGNMYVVKYDGSKKEEKVDEDEMLNLYDARV
ncbi:hypothetical protein PNOK_0752700 [Pyrrhoderma noxium]|uniref:Uncharacterized protein n=1 Tax=Pyrrhoderma noxium TaxID=2282107 RepID=A0A286UD04_9AGAM|nr:hypothetical protein PNOK_0752700 [Pyrrhoderma noxium]